MADQVSSKEALMDEENEPLIKKAKLSTKSDLETAGPEGTSLLDTYKIDSGGDRMPVELIGSAINSPKNDEKDEPSIDR